MTVCVVPARRQRSLPDRNERVCDKFLYVVSLGIAAQPVP